MCCICNYNHSKLDPKSQKCVFLGYGERDKCYRLWLRDIRGYKVIISRSVIFNENDFTCRSDKINEKIRDDDFIITEIDLNKENTNVQVPLEVEQPQTELNKNPDVEILNDNQDLSVIH